VLVLANSGAAYAADTAGAAPANSPAPSSGRDVFGNLAGTNVQGNPNDKNAQGRRPKDAQGNVPKDIWGNKVGTENK
jgi:hypothetical protein